MTAPAVEVEDSMSEGEHDPAGAAGKAALRATMRDRRLALSADAVRERSEAACRRVGELVANDELRVAALYAAIRNELDPTPLARLLAARGVVLAYPRVDTAAQRLTFHRVGDPSELVPRGRYRIPEPVDGAPEVAPGLFDLVIVPGLAFDAEGYRVGWGAGFYDAMLPSAPLARRIGMAYELQIVPRCPREPGDEPVDVIATEARVFVTGARR